MLYYNKELAHNVELLNNVEKTVFLDEFKKLDIEIISTLLLFLEPKKTADILADLEISLQVEIIAFIGNFVQISQESLLFLINLVNGTDNYHTVEHCINYKKIGGPDKLIQILNLIQNNEKLIDLMYQVDRKLYIEVVPHLL